MPTYSVNGHIQEEVADNANSFASSTTGASTSAVSITMPAQAGLIAVVTGVTVTSVHAAATVESAFTISGLSTFAGGSGTLTYEFVQSNTLGGLLDLDFSNPLPASGAGSAITFSLAGIAGGGTVAIAVQGFYRS